VGKAHPITSDVMDYPIVSSAGDSQSFVALQKGELSSLWIASPNPKWEATKITQGQRRRDGIGGLAWGPSGRIVYVSSPGGVMQIWTSREDGTDANPLTDAKTVNFNPSVCPDGRTVVFNSGPPRHIWKIQMDGSQLQQLTSGPDESWPICTADGQSVLFLSTKPSYRVMKIPVVGGAPSVLTEQTIIMPSMSPDGKSLLATIPEGQRNRVVVLPLDGGPARKLFDVERPKVHWSPDGKSVLYVETTDGIRDVWRRNLDGTSK